jgi:hypothetical protein
MPVDFVENQESQDQVPPALLTIGGVAALIVAFLSMTEAILFTFLPQPDSVIGWFRLFGEHPLVALVDFWGLELPMYAMFSLVFLALYALLRKSGRTSMAIALILVLLGTAIFFATNNPFSMLSLGSKYAAATTVSDKSALLAAGEAILAGTNQRAIGGFNIGLFLVSIAGILASLVMRRGQPFTKTTAYVGILGFGLSLADYLRQFSTDSIVAALLVILSGALVLVVWFTLVGRRLLQIAHSGV